MEIDNTAEEAAMPECFHLKGEKANILQSDGEVLAISFPLELHCQWKHFTCRLSKREGRCLLCPVGQGDISGLVSPGG
jgi:hypothetical protein